MKKIYVSPETILQEIELSYVIAGSQTPQNFSFDPNEEASDDNGEILSRRRYRNDWEDEEYDEEENL